MFHERKKKRGHFLQGENKQDSKQRKTSWIEISKKKKIKLTWVCNECLANRILQHNKFKIFTVLNDEVELLQP